MGVGPVRAITFQRLGREHFELLGRWLAEPHVARWWNHDPSPAAIEDDFGDTIDGIEPDVGHVVVPVNSANVASWRALLSAGFRLVAQGEMAPDNPIDDRPHEILRIDRPTVGAE